MIRSMKLYCPLLAVFIAAGGCVSAAAQYVLENDSLARTISTKHAVLRTTQIVNKRARVTVVPEASPEFRLRFSGGTNGRVSVMTLTSSDFRVIKAAPFESATRKGLTVTLANVDRGLRVELVYEL